MEESTPGSRSAAEGAGRPGSPAREGPPPASRDPFETHVARYERWFDRHPAAYLSELLAVRALLPWRGLGLEIGVGSGRFAAPLGVACGIDPAGRMLERARERRIAVARAVSERLPFADGAFDYALVVTTICFVRDIAASLREARRILRAGGVVVIGLVDRTSPLGRRYLAHRAENVFYRHADFYSAPEVEGLLARAGFTRFSWVQTLSRPLTGMREVEPVRPGRGEGAFLVVKARRE